MDTLQLRVSNGRLSLSAVLLFLFGSASAQPTGGDWTIPTDFGQLVITVAYDGTEIQTIKTTFSAYSCGGRTQSGTITSSQTPSWPITNRQFVIDLSFFPGDVKLNITGIFAESGIEASGSWSVDVLGTTCSGTWGPVFNPIVNKVDDEIPERFALAQNYPNPFNPSTTISFSLPTITHVKLAVFDVLGIEVRVLVDDLLSVGVHEETFYAARLPSGIYIYKLETPTETITKKMQLVK